MPTKQIIVWHHYVIPILNFFFKDYIPIGSWSCTKMQQWFFFFSGGIQNMFSFVVCISVFVFKNFPHEYIFSLECQGEKK